MLDTIQFIMLPSKKGCASYCLWCNSYGNEAWGEHLVNFSTLFNILLQRQIIMGSRSPTTELFVEAEIGKGSLPKWAGQTYSKRKGHNPRSNSLSNVAYYNFSLHLHIYIIILEHISPFQPWSHLLFNIGLTHTILISQL